MALTKVAVGCQGGGMHAAFEVGVLTEILRDVADKKFDLVGLSGTSAGALCALMTWYGLAPKKSGPGSAQEAIDALERAWDAFTADTPTETVLNQLAYSAFRLQEMETPVLGLNTTGFGVNPASFVSRTITRLLPSLDVRKQYFDLMEFLEKACPEFDSITWGDVKTRLLIGATEIVQGCETVFDSAANVKAPPPSPNRWRKRLPLHLKSVAASGTLPEFSQTVRINNGYYWDGGYSQNPPVRDFFSGTPKADTPDELWIVRINPQQWPEPPASRADIVDRENEMIGNLSLNKELDFIFTVNKLIRRYGDGVAKKYKPVTVRTIKMTEKTADELRYSSKFDRSPAFTNRLRDEGTAVGRDWLDRWPKNVGSWPDDAAYR
jgi:NTE family protein